MGLVLLAGLIQPVLAQEQLKVGFVNASQILEKSPQAEEARRRLEKEFEERDKAIVEMQRNLRTLEDRRVDEFPSLSEEDKLKLQRQIRELDREIERAREAFRDDFNIRRNEELGKLQRLVYAAITSLAKEDKYDLIVNDGAVIYASEKANITDKVLQRMQQQ